MEHKNNMPFPGRGPAGGDPMAPLFGRLDGLDKMVNELLNDPNIRRMALEIGVVLLAKKYPALSFLLGTMLPPSLETSPAVTRRVPDRKPLPPRKRLGL